MPKNLSFSDETLLDWVRWDPPPPWSKKSEYFLIRIFWIGRDPPAPLLTESQKNPVFFFTPPLKRAIALKWPFRQTNQSKKDGNNTGNVNDLADIHVEVEHPGNRLGVFVSDAWAILRCWGIWTTWTLLNWWRPSLCLILAIVVYKMLGQWCIDVSWSLSSVYVGGEHPGHVKLARFKCLGISAFGKLKPVKDILTTVVVHYMNGQSVQLYKWYAGAILVPLTQSTQRSSGVARKLWQPTL